MESFAIASSISTGFFLDPPLKVMRPRPSHPLPKGWYQATAENGSSYYYDTSGNTQWQRPGNPADPTSRMEEMEPARSPHRARQRRMRIEHGERVSSMQPAQYPTDQSFHVNLSPTPPPLVTPLRPPPKSTLDWSKSFPIGPKVLSSSQVAYKQNTHQILGKGRGRREEKEIERKVRLPTITTAVEGSRSTLSKLSKELASYDLAPAPLPNPFYDPPSWVPSPFTQAAPRSTEGPRPQPQSELRRRYNSYRAPGTQFRTYQGPGERGRERGQASTTTSEMMGQPTISRYDKYSDIHGSQPDVPLMNEHGERITYLKDALEPDRPQDFHDLTESLPPTPAQYSIEYNEDEQEDEREQALGRSYTKWKRLKRSYSGTPQHPFLKDQKGAASEITDDYAINEAWYLEQRAPKFGRQENEEPTRNDEDHPDSSHRKKMKYTISEDLTEGRSRRLKAKYFALECSQSSSLYALRR